VPTVIVLWIDKDAETYHSLAYNGGGGLIRAYPRDQYDSRCDLGRDKPLPFIDTPGMLAKHFGSTKGIDSMVQVPAYLVVKMGLYKTNEIDW